jgi:hypothetical protein
MNSMEIEVIIKSIYGNDKVYIADKALAETITLLTGAKTLSPQHIHALKMLGYSLKVVVEQKSLQQQRRWHMSTSIAAKVGIGSVAVVVLVVVSLLEFIGLFVAAMQGIWSFLIASVFPPRRDY